MKKTKKSKKAIILKVIKIVSVSLLVTGILVLGLYRLVTYQWQDEPKEYPATNQYITGLGDTMVSAHRAGKNLFPQGTMMAFEGCINSETFETDVFEFDLHLTADDKLIVLHDDTLDDSDDRSDIYPK
jgi:glycerophosphoryl diester phosphodiesterase